jgi:hypothetical protein
MRHIALALILFLGLSGPGGADEPPPLGPESQQFLQGLWQQVLGGTESPEKIWSRLEQVLQPAGDTVEGLSRAGQKAAGSLEGLAPDSRMMDLLFQVLRQHEPQIRAKIQGRLPADLNRLEAILGQELDRLVRSPQAGAMKDILANPEARVGRLIEVLRLMRSGAGATAQERVRLEQELRGRLQEIFPGVR